jgi:hypothetical protein
MISIDERILDFGWLRLEKEELKFRKTWEGKVRNPSCSKALVN